MTPPEQHQSNLSDDPFHLAWTHAAHVRHFIRRVTGDAAEADDLAQDTYVRVLQYLRSGKSIQRLDTFLMHVARNIAFDWLRRRHCALVDYADDEILQDVIDAGADVEERVRANQEIDELETVLNRHLSSRTRQAFTLRRICGFSQIDISTQLNISENTVEALVSKGSRALRAYVAEKGRRVPNDSRNLFLERSLRRPAV